ncbi:Rab GDP dissociation inhibitor [Cryptosporidium ubiquitum]|uniref:Rab GDP dissociation inhibitor n=1 Tax=Cryptosporidium ubiquitum TaxID=857276 RepID=A0A1J4MQ71_9CRYT|nr:Rab GDP dissociation inhibitor [Cryptosporidium ubiquitum]OII75037.1 Rab GDP dissociation inhibitor [Cryptosporidium ubiquitum]
MEEAQNGDSWDVVVLGTGLIECIVASGLSMRGYSVLVLDSNTSYGGLSNTVKLPTAHNWISDSPEHSNSLFETSSFFEKEYDIQVYSSLTETESENLKNIYIDMMPKVLFCRGHLVEMILSCNISGYLEFQGIEDIYFVDIKDKETLKLTRTPFSKKEVFSSTELNLVEKRQIMRLYSGIRDILEISKIEEKVDLDLVSDPFRTPALIVNTQNSSKKNNSYDNIQNSNKNTCISEIASFSDFQDFWKINDRILDLVKHNIVFCSSNCNEQFQWKKNFTRYFNLLLSSLNQHGCIGTPFLYPNYGTCDLPQSFSRLAAVKGSVQRLGTDISSIERQFEKEKLWKIHINSNNLKEVIQSKLILGSLNSFSKYLKNPINNIIEKRVLCYFIILNHPLITPKNSQNHKKLCLASIRIGENQLDNNIAYILQCDHYTGCCPSGYYIVYINKIMGMQETTLEARSKIQNAINSFLSEKTNSETKILYKASYIYKQKVENPELLSDGLILLSDPSINNNSFFLLDEDVDNAILALDKSLKFLSSQNQENVTFHNFSNSEKDQQGKENPRSQELSNQYIIKKLQNILD